MTLLSTAQHLERGSRRPYRNHVIPAMLSCALAAVAIGRIAYLLWPPWGTEAAKAPARLPVSIGAALFTVPPPAIRMKIQRHSGPQERVDLF